MELVWLVYAISLIGPIKGLAVFGSMISGLGTIMCWMWETIDNSGQRVYGLTWFVTSVFVLSGLISVFVPSEKTAYTMVAAYATQKVAEAPETKEIASDVLTIINSKVKQYALESVQELEKATKK